MPDPEKSESVPPEAEMSDVLKSPEGSESEKVMDAVSPACQPTWDSSVLPSGLQHAQLPCRLAGIICYIAVTAMCTEVTVESPSQPNHESKTISVPMGSPGTASG